MTAIITHLIDITTGPLNLLGIDVFALSISLNPDGTGGGGTFDFEDVPPSAPPKVKEFGQRMFGAGKYLGLLVGLFFLGVAAMKIMAGKGQRHNLAAEGLSNIVSIFGGIGVLMVSVSIISFVATGF
ncbi:hypothetical protein OG339_48495 (plasmid) [Streptosporangium sp. NBC_01495]|uniref:hypothetical protein n=1 Tax=Streptosporangium sp. NBC_01495 TaxID=2903899 RepID=UPI002E3382C5|nr:hypothetical protein [Streptosporangium sp. NBC_01495]